MGAYVGQTAPKVRNLFAKNDVIFIDEAYGLTSEDSGGINSYAQEALSQLCIELEEHSKDKLIILAGYGGEDVDVRENRMQGFLDANPGIRSRIGGTVVFRSYDADQMLAISKKHAMLMQMTLEDGSMELIRSYFADRVKDRNFGNGREARRLIENAVKHMAVRLTTDGRMPDSTQLSLITAEDIKNAIEELGVAKESGTNPIGFVA